MKVVVVMPAFNVAGTLERTWRGLPESFRQDVLLGDNQSTDGTLEVARRLGIDVLRHEKNHGYGGNLKRLFRQALANGADVVVELHPDFQYDPGLVDILVEFIRRGYFDVVQGNRIRSRDEALAGGMPWYRYIGNRALTLFENVWFGLTLGEWHSGMKAIRAEVLARLPLETYHDSHAFASDLLMDCVAMGFRVGEIPVPVRYDSESSSVSLPGLFGYSLRTIVSALKRPPWRRKRFGSAQLPLVAGEGERLFENGVAEEGVRCPVCRGRSWKEVAPETRDDFHLFLCGQCRCYRIERQRPPLPELYNRYYLERSTQRLTGVFHGVWRFFRRRKAQLMMRHLQPDSFVCDVGCERGELLYRLKQAGHRVVGTQLSVSAADFARQRFGIDVFVGELPDVPFEEALFDAVVMNHVLEHLPNPEQYLARIIRILRPGGALWVEVPNAGSFTARLCGKNWLLHDPEHHIWSFNKEGLINLLRGHGFLIERAYHTSWEYGPIGCLQSWLNFLPGEKNMIFQIVRDGFFGVRAPLWVRLFHVALGSALLPVACVGSLAEGLCGNGPIILVHAKKPDEPRGFDAASYTVSRLQTQAS